MVSQSPKSEYTVVVNASEKSTPGHSSLHMSQMSSFLLSFQRNEAEADTRPWGHLSV